MLDLSNNLLTGHIPPSIGNTRMLEINLSNNQIGGTIPASIGNITGLAKLVLNNNKLTGSIPKELGRLYRYFKYLYLNNNKLSGTIPDLLGYAAHLYDLDISNNQLSGLIPSNLGYLKLLYQLNLNDNNLSGRIPSTFSNFYRIDTLRLQHNHLSGTIPALDSLNRLRDLSLRLNNFTFNGLEAIQQEYGSKALYYNQAIIPLHQHTNTLAVTAGGTLSNNTYTWYKDGTAYATHTGDSTLPITVNGSYYVSVTNAIATELTLYSDTLTESSFNKPAATIALYPNPAISNATTLFNATGNYIVTLSNASGSVLQTITGTSNKVQNKVDLNINSYPSGMYFITIKDEKETRLLKLTKE